MSHLEERLEQDLKQINALVGDQASRVGAAVANALRALQTSDKNLAYQIVLGDHEINRTMRDVDQACHRFIAVHLPSGQHLRVISSVIRMNVELERVGDYAVNIARQAAQIKAAPSEAIADELSRIADKSMKVFEQAVEAFKQLDTEMATDAINLTSQLEHNLDSIYAALLDNKEHEQLKDILAVFVVFNQLKRVADQAKNLCEHTIFAATGEQKPQKTYNILFLDKENKCMSQMAEAIARNRFPNSGQYSSAGLKPAESLHQGLLDFMGEHRLDANPLEPKSVAAITDHALANYQIIVVLEGAIGDYIDKVPFHTSVLEWDVGGQPDKANKDAVSDLYRTLSLKINDLIVQLRGHEAN